jgi:SAM-dependent methyltransferase
VQHKRVLDAGCGPGIYSQWLINHGAQVVAVDASPKMIELTRQRVGPQVDVRQADLSKPLDFLESSSFDVVLSPLVFNYIEDWRLPFSEFYRILRPAGHFVFSVEHPFSDYLHFKADNYYETELVGQEWKGFDGVRVWMPSFRRPLDAILNPLIEAGFTLKKTVEAKPTDEFKAADLKDYEKLSRRPCFLCVSAQK